MKYILILVILVIIYYTYRGELFSDYYSFVKLYSNYTDSSLYASYYSCDGKYLNYTFRKPLNRVDIRFITGGASVKIYGYTGVGMCGDSPVYVYYATDNGQTQKINSLWRLLVNETGIGEKTINLHTNYQCHHIELKL